MTWKPPIKSTQIGFSAEHSSNKGKNYVQSKKPHIIVIFLKALKLIPWSQRFFFIFHCMKELRESREAANTRGLTRVAKRRERKTSGYLGLESHLHDPTRENWHWSYPYFNWNRRFVSLKNTNYKTRFKRFGINFFENAIEFNCGVTAERNEPKWVVLNSIPKVSVLWVDF